MFLYSSSSHSPTAADRNLFIQSQYVNCYTICAAARAQYIIIGKDFRSLSHRR